MRARSWSVCAAAVLLASLPGARLFGQSRFEPQFWAAGYFGIGSQTRGCSCQGITAPDPASGPVIFGTAGIDLLRGFGVGIAKGVWFLPDLSESGTGRNTSFTDVVFRYTPPRFTALALHLGVGSATSSDDALGTGGSMLGTVGVGGVSMRLPARSLVGFTISGEYLRAFSGTQPNGSRYRPQMVLLAVGIDVSSHPPDQPP